MNKVFVAVLLLILAGGALYFFTKPETPTEQQAPPEQETVIEITADTPDEQISERIGTSVEGRDILAYRFGSGDTKLVFVGAMHGGYEWNSALLSYTLIDYLKGNVGSIPQDVRVIVIPVANPDGLAKVVGTSGRFQVTDAPQFDYADEVDVKSTVVAGRFNAHGVDLNRNFDCKWQPKAMWRSNEVSAGTAPFSEPESAALRDFFLKERPAAVVFYHSASNGVYTSFCEGDPLPGTVALLDTYSAASGYKRYDDYPYYEVTGDSADWLATQGIPAVTVELETHDVAEWEKNLAGIEALFAHYSTL